jgi:hypothetical protein
VRAALAVIVLALMTLRRSFPRAPFHPRLSSGEPTPLHSRAFPATIGDALVIPLPARNSIALARPKKSAASSILIK